MSETVSCHCGMEFLKSHAVLEAQNIHVKYCLKKPFVILLIREFRAKNQLAGVIYTVLTNRGEGGQQGGSTEIYVKSK